MDWVGFPPCILWVSKFQVLDPCSVLTEQQRVVLGWQLDQQFLWFWHLRISTVDDAEIEGVDPKCEYETLPSMKLWLVI